MSELKPCPFCGELPKRASVGVMTYLYCDNKKCLIQPTTIAYKAKGADTRVWNRRAKDDD